MLSLEEEFEEYIKSEIERIEGTLGDNNLELTWLAVVHEAAEKILKERHLTPFGAFKKWKEGR